MSVFSFIQQRDTAGIILLLSTMLRPVVAGHPVASAAVQYLLLTRCSAAYCNTPQLMGQRQTLDRFIDFARHTIR